MINLNLIVLRTQNLELTVQWYSQTFGLNFISEKHGEGTLHYSASLENGLIEIYPTNKTFSKITFGFSVNRSLFEKIAQSKGRKSLEDNSILLNDFMGNSIILSFLD